MKKITVAIVVAVLVLSVLPKAQAASKVERDLEEMKRRLEAVEQATIGGGSNRLSAMEAQLETLTQQQAKQQAELDALRVEFQKLRGALDDQQHTRQELHDLLNMMRSEMELKFNAIEGRVGKLEQAPAAVPQAPVAVSDPATEYEAALKLIQKDGEYVQGRKGLQDFLQKYPDHELAVNAIYWIGEAYYGEKKYENAILQFQDILQKYPHHSKASAAQLKQALAFQALGDNETATVLLKKVIKNYPDSPEAKKARERLGQPGH